MKPPDEDHNQNAGDSLDGFLETPIFRLNPMSDRSEGKTIDNRYVVERELSHTAMSQVFLARDLRLQKQPVVIKVLSEALFADAEARKRFDNELKILLHLEEHPHVVRVTDAGALADDRPYLVMPYIDGETLRSKIQPNVGMDLERAAAILKQIGAALDFVHENEVFHRDFKPENIMLRRGTDSVVLIDFGIAKARRSMFATPTANSMVAGTVAYMSPEQLDGQRITASSDVYSMAVVAYEMLTGRRPFNHESPWKLPELQRAGVRVRPMHLRAQLSAKADRIITRALSFEPTARYKTAGEFANKLAEALLEPPESPWWPPIPRWPIPWWLKVTGGLFILALLTFGIFEYCGKKTEPSRSFRYWLTVQEIRDGQEYQEPYQSNGEEKFNNGDKFRLNVLSPTPAFLYVFTQRPFDASDTSFFMIYPNAAINGGSSSIGANQPVQSESFTFQDLAGDENFWIVWSVSPVIELESARVEALKHPRGGLTGESMVAVQAFLRTKQADFKTTISHYEEKQVAIARGKTNILVAFVQFKHR